MGRDKKNEQRTEHFAKMVRNLMSTDAWRALPLRAQALYPWLKLEWKGPRHNNNGKIQLSVRQAADRMGCNPKTAAEAFHDLQAKGFIVVKEPGCLGVEGYGKAPSFEITELPLPGTGANIGSRLYENWREGYDYPVITGTVHNPMGRNGKAKTYAPKRNIVVPIRGTKG